VAPGVGVEGKHDHITHDLVHVLLRHFRQQSGAGPLGLGRRERACVGVGVGVGVVVAGWKAKGGGVWRGYSLRQAKQFAVQVLLEH
jgi:hypothetical protein